MRFFDKLDGLKYYLEQREFDRQPNQFPSMGINYTRTYKEIEDYMNSSIHSYVGIGAANSGNGVLTDHGVKHIITVIARATKLIENNIEEFVGYEIFILLLAIHFHDVGNVSGRDEHEQKIFDIMDKLSVSQKLDYPERRNIINIAMAHGGYVDGDNKDTISSLPDVDYVNGVKIRPSLLAAILRFSDEIADDKTRTTIDMINIGVIPQENLIYHLYSLSLQPPIIEGDTIKLEYIITYENAVRKFKKGDDENFLYDEILNRLKKCLCELEYCRKYSQGYIKIIALSVSIEIIDDKQKRCLDKSQFKLRLAGYPNMDTYNLKQLCVDGNLKHSDGEQLKQKLEEKIR